MRFWRSLRDHFLPSRYNAHRPHILRRGWLIAFLGLALISEGVILGRASLTGGPNVLLSAVVQSDVVNFTDRARQSEGGSPLRENETLDAAAQLKADDMAARGYFSHVGPDGAQPWTWLDRAGYDYVYAGENLAVRFDDSKMIVDAWMASPTHRANIIKPQYQEIGVGIADGEYKGAPASFVVQFFASPSLTKAAAAKAAALEPEPQVVADAAPALATTPAVAGAQTVTEAPPASAPVPKESFMQSLTRALNKAFGDSGRAATWTLSGLAALLGLVLALTFFVRIQVQPTDLLIPGAAVAIVALVLLGANAKFLPASMQSASVIESQGGDIGDAASIQRVNVVSP